MSTSRNSMWYFSNQQRQLRYGDKRVAKVGESHQVSGPPVPCQHGLHASKRILDALSYAPGNIIFKVELSGEVVHQVDKSCATVRAYISGGIDISNLLRKFARLCALDVIHLWSAPQVVIDYLKTGDESLRDAAWAAAGDAAWAAGAKQNRRLTAMVSAEIKKRGSVVLS